MSATARYAFHVKRSGGGAPKRLQAGRWSCPVLVDTKEEVDTVLTMDEEKKQKRARRAFTEEFKAEAVRLVLDEGKSVAGVARDLDLTTSALRVWVERARADRTKGKTGLTSEERAELSRLRKENRTLKMERDIPKKAAALFARDQA